MYPTILVAGLVGLADPLFFPFGIAQITPNPPLDIVWVYTQFFEFFYGLIVGNVHLHNYLRWVVESNARHSNRSIVW